MTPFEQFAERECFPLIRAQCVAQGYPAPTIAELREILRNVCQKLRAEGKLDSYFYSPEWQTKPSQ